MNGRLRRLMTWFFAVLLALSCVSCGEVSASDGIYIVPRDPVTAAPAPSVPQPSDPPASPPEEKTPGTTVSDPETEYFCTLAASILSDPAFAEIYERCRDSAHPDTALIAAVLAYQTAKQTSSASETETETGIPQSGLVYYTENGSVYHCKRSCSALAKSRQVLSGTVEDAVRAGKSRRCRRCGG